MNKERISLFLILSFFLSLPTVLFSYSLGLVSIPVADVRDSTGNLPKTYEQDPHEQTQILYGERVHILSEMGDWYQVEIPQQPKWIDSDRWQGYPGWVRKNSIQTTVQNYPTNYVVSKKFTELLNQPNSTGSRLFISLGTKLQGSNEIQNGFRKIIGIRHETYWIKDTDILRLNSIQSESEKRDRIVQEANELLGDPYLWGGCSAHIPPLGSQVTAVDCSGLVHLMYRVIGMKIPRDSKDQYLKSRKIEKSELKKGDLIFSAPVENPNKIIHVAIFVDPNILIEAPQTGGVVRLISFKMKYGVPFSKIESGKIVGDRVLYLGTFFK